MSILSPTKPYAPAAPGINAKIQDAQGRLRSLEDGLAQLALEAELGDTGAQSRLAKRQEQIAAEKAVIARLRLAHSAGQARDQEAERAQRASLRKAQIAALRKHLDSRDAAAEALCAAIAEVVKQFKIVVERSKKAGAIVPVGDALPPGTICEFGELKALVAQELYRADGGDVLLGARLSFPGAAVLDLNHQGKPEAIEPLADRLKRNSAFIIDTITRRAS